eukprot:TRINITY_DN6373_c0_g1_i1.p1 TRINITY_DN6373_c0_g1~~TRINITY_DN6373_c0_g1_i1.p1  ORF type:complete len:332 (+),score=63.54 TRINITY_DN6373_c0_g1_i1:140-997(+)
MFQLPRVAEFLKRKNIVVITGAGLSTESGIPDYRSPNGSYSKGHKPVTIQEFMGSENVRKRYWARNLQGWDLFSNAKPNEGHKCIASLEKHGFIDQILTQNVDSLHQKAGSEKVIELHGSSHAVICMGCTKEFSRSTFQKELIELNPNWVKTIKRVVKDKDVENVARPDGDFDLGERDFTKFNVPSCHACQGIIKPHVVMFGENVPRIKVDTAFKKISECDGVLVMGTSLQVWSAFRFVKAASEDKKDICIVNIGPTRGDPLSFLKVEARLGDISTQLLQILEIQ